MKFYVNLSEAEVARLDEPARVWGLLSRSAALREAIRLLPQPGLEEAYGQAWEEWDASGEREAWESVACDRLS